VVSCRPGSGRPGPDRGDLDGWLLGALIKIVAATIDPGRSRLVTLIDHSGTQHAGGLIERRGPVSARLDVRRRPRAGRSRGNARHRLGGAV